MRFRAFVLARGGRGGEDTVISGNIIAKRQTRWTTRETQVRGRCVLQKEQKDVKYGCEIKMAHFVLMNAPPPGQVVKKKGIKKSRKIEKNEKRTKGYSSHRLRERVLSEC